MNAIVLQEPGRFVMNDRSEPGAPGVGEVQVQVRRVGICGTDLRAYRGQQPFFSYPRVLGHELGVEVMALGPGVSGVPVGACGAVDPFFCCGRCSACRRGHANCCEALRMLGIHLDGGMQARLNLPAEKLHCSAALSLEQLALIEPLSIGAHAIDRAAVESSESVLVIGTGPVGLGTIRFAQLAGAEVAAADTHAARLSFAHDQLGVEQVIHAEQDPEAMRAAVRQAFEGELPEVVLDTTGEPASMRQAFELVEASGRLVFVGLFPGDYTFPDTEFHRRELALLATRNSTAADFEHIVAEVEVGRIDTSVWITHRVPFEQVIEQFEGWLDPDTGVVKAMVTL